MKITLAIPTFNEKENLPILIEQIQKQFEQHGLEGSIVVVDDASPDGTGAVADALVLRHSYLKIVHREKKMGLSSAAIAAWQSYPADIFMVMDADLSHPTEKIPELVAAIAQEHYDLAIGSRYQRGGKIVGWSLHRKILSKMAKCLALGFTDVQDPMSGFFAIRSSCVQLSHLNAQGFKILLELLVKANCARIKEIPIVFTDRRSGSSKAGWKEIFYYLKNLIGYIIND